MISFHFLKDMNKRTFLIVTIQFILVTVSGKITLPNYFASNMVLQQQSDVLISGTSDRQNHTVSVFSSWNKQKLLSKTDSKGYFRVSLKTPSAGGPYTIIIDDGDQLTLENILIGEVWLCAGQSNMEMPMRGFDRQPLIGANEIISKAKPRTPIRMFITDSEDGHWIRQYSKTPQYDIKGKWLDNAPENVAVCSATAYYFACYLQEVLEVPVGVMVTTLGGARIEPFMSREALQPFSKVRYMERLDGEIKEGDAYNVPTLLFNAKIHPLTALPIRGFLWYQGESNRDNANQYADLMAAMVNDWRQKWNNPEAPFYFVEIAPYNYEGADGTSAAFLREAQMQAAHKIRNCGIVSTLDIGAPNFIHPVDKKTVGDRLALLALAQTYHHKGFGYACPQYQSMEVKDSKVYINLINAGNGPCPMWTSLKGFEIAGEDHVFYPAFAEVETKTCRLAVSNVKVPHPVAVRYCFKNYAEASVFNISGLPLHPFRTDNWDK